MMLHNVEAKNIPLASGDSITSTSRVAFCQQQKRRSDINNHFKSSFPCSSSCYVSRFDENFDTHEFGEDFNSEETSTMATTTLQKLLELERTPQHPKNTKPLPLMPSPLTLLSQVIFSIVSLLVGGYWLLLLSAIVTTFASYGIDGIFLRVR